jgi:acyl dehydratase
VGVSPFDTPPVVPLWKTALKRGPGGPIPHIAATARRLRGDPAAYAEVCGLPASPMLPLCFPDMLCRGLQLAVLTDPAFPVPLLGIVHVRQRIEQRRGIAADEPLSGHVWVEGHRPARRGGELDMHTVVSNGEEALWHGVTTILSRDLPRLPQEPTQEPTQKPGQNKASKTDIVFQHQRSTAWTVPEDLGRRYARVSGDVNPIHHYAWTAKLFGFKRAIAHGWWTLARCLAEMDVSSDTWPGVLSVDARFLSPVSLPSTVWFTSGPMDETVDGVTGTTSGFALRSSGKLALTGTVTQTIAR